MILVACSDTYGDSTYQEFETIAQAQDWIAVNYVDYDFVTVYTKLAHEINVKVTISEDVTIF
jgi:hypothetical protein